MALRDTPGTIIVPTGDTSRYTEFWICLDRLVQPQGTQLNVVRGANIADNLNRALREIKGEWVQIWGDDHTFPPGLLLALLDRLDAHPEVDILVPLTTKRRQPFCPPFGVTWWIGDGGAHMEELPWSLVPNPLDNDGLFEIGQGGLAGAVIRKKVIDGIRDPWFGWATEWDLTHGIPILVQYSEDYHFCKKVREAGFKIHVDLAQPVGHIISPTLVPRWSPKLGCWVTDIKVDNWVISTMRQTIAEVEKK